LGVRVVYLLVRVIVRVVVIVRSRVISRVKDTPCTFGLLSRVRTGPAQPGSGKNWDQQTGIVQFQTWAKA
jgi:hypothetical protein